MLFIELRGASTIDHPAPPKRPPPPFKKKKKTPRTSTTSPPSRAHTHLLIVKQNRTSDDEGSGATVEKSRHRSPVVTLKIVCSPSQLRSLVILSPPLPPPRPTQPHRTTLTSDCGDMATSVRKEIDFTERTFLCFLYFTHPARQMTLMTFIILMLFAIVLTSGFGKVLV